MIRARTRLALAGASCLVGWAVFSAVPAATDSTTGWHRNVIENLRRAEYHYSAVGDGTWSAPNRAQNIRSFVTAEGLRLTPRLPAAQPWEVELRLVGFGRGDALTDTGAAVQPLVADGNRVELIRAPLTEWYVNEREGIEQGFTIPTAPAHGVEGQPVVIEMRVSGENVAVDMSSDAQEVLFRTASGRAALRYDSLIVLDAEGRRLPSRFESAGDRLRIVADDAGAVYPLLVDPLVTDPNWSAEGNQALSSFGVSVASAGDVNNDGYDDVIVGADDFDNFEADEGHVFVYHGGPSGPAVTPSWRIESDHAFSKFGRTVASAGDIDNDGYDDIIIGAPEYDDDPSGLIEKDEGWAFVFFGSATGLPNGPATTVLSADWTGQANQEEAAYGRRVASAGDVNNDGYDDVVIGAPDYSNDQAFEGAAFLYLGSATGLGPSGLPTNADWRAEGNFVNSLFGHGLASAGDVNGDLRDDVIVGARNYEANYEDEGQVRLYLGAGSDLSDTPVWVLDGGQNNMRLGVSVDSAGDVNGDGYDDLLIGADLYSNGQSGEGAAFVFPGDPNPALLGTTPAWTAEVNQGDAFLGFSVAGAGDVNNDGYDDVIVGAEGFDNGELDEGAAFLYYGSATGLALSPSRSFEINQAGARYGISVASAGDVNDDGHDDVIVGADKFTKLQSEEGGAFLYFGCQDDEQDGVCDSVDNCPDLFNPDQLDTDLDGLGDVCDACQDVDIDGVCDQPRVLIESSGPGEQVVVQAGSSMRYLANIPAVDPGIVLEWTELVFPDEAFPPWQVGVYGVGFETEPGGAQNLLQTTNPPDPGTISVFTRAQFAITSAADVSTLFLGADWDDGFIAWINGVEVFRSPQMPTGTPLWATPAQFGHECSNGSVPDYGKLHDISFTGIPALRDGLNVLAVGVWNVAPGSSDLVLVPRLSINRPKTSTMRYLANNADPGLGAAWTETGFDEVANGWSPGNYGVGFEAVAGADDLINTDVPTDTVSVFTRARINIDPATVESVFYGADYDDGTVIWINGTEVYRSPEMPGTPGVVPPWNADPAPPHESSNGAVPDYTPLHDITSAAKPEFFQGENVVAIGVWTSSTDVDDLVLVPRLSINENNIDNCIDVFNPPEDCDGLPGTPDEQCDLDGDGLGDACDPDIDDDGHLNGVDNCPFVANDQSDGDGDGIGNECDSCPDDAGNDADLDGICAGTGYAPPMAGDGDNCPSTFNPPEDCDDLPGTPDEQCDLDIDGIGDACDPDIDGDTVDNGLDNCPWVSNVDQDDFDSDTFGDACDCAFDNDQAWEVPSTVDSVLMAKTDSCGNYACSESGGVCVGDADCNYDFCQDYYCSLSAGPCTSDLDCETDTCQDFTCTAGLNPCVSDAECTADFCDNRTCTAGANPCTGDGDCTADFCDNMECTDTLVPCSSSFDCFGGPTDLCVGACSLGGNFCVADSNCTQDVCGDGTCSVGGNVCSDDTVCTADTCEGTCSIGANACTSDVQCTAPQVDLCEGTCTLGMNVCAGDVDCTVPQTDLCLGACTIGGNACSSDAACVAPAVDTLFWLEPAAIGGTGVVYDTLRSAVASDFMTGTTCVETDGLNRITSDGTIPASGTVLHYLIRVENECPDGNMGSSSSGPRTGMACE
jgi:hypothetical protein